MGPGKTVDTERYAVLCANLLGSCYGTGPAEVHPSACHPARPGSVVQLLIDDLGVRSVALAAGDRSRDGGDGWRRRTIVRAVRGDLRRAAAHTAYAIAWNHVQRAAVEAAGGRGLEIARMVGMMTYRTASEQAARFGRAVEADGRWSVAAYLDHQGRKLRDRFSVESYVALTKAMDAHDVGRGRGGVAEALGRIEGRLVGVGIPGDLLYAPEDVRAWVDAAGGEYREIISPHGHDAFLLDLPQVGEILADALASVELATVDGGA